jgi:uroporphyrinogen decarboxylase
MWKTVNNWAKLNIMLQQYNKSILQALKKEKTGTVPMWLMRQAGRHLPEYREVRSTTNNFLDFCYNSELASKVTLQPVVRYGVDAAILFSDILVITHALGQHVNFVPGRGPVLEPITDINDIKKLNVKHININLKNIYKTVSIVKSKINDEFKTTTLIGFAGSPWTVATYMIEGGSSKDYMKTKSWCYTSPKEFSILMDILAEATVEYLCQQIDHGVEVIQLFDSWAGVLSESQFANWVIKPTKVIINNIRKKHPSIPIIGFPRGAGVLYKNFVVETGVDCISIDPSIPIEWAAKYLQSECVVQGNLDNLSLLVGNKNTDNEVTKILTGLSNGPFIFNLGHGILPTTTIKNVNRLIKLVKGFKIEKKSRHII